MKSIIAIVLVIVLAVGCSGCIGQVQCPNCGSTNVGEIDSNYGYEEDMPFDADQYYCYECQFVFLENT